MGENVFYLVDYVERRFGFPCFSSTDLSDRFIDELNGKCEFEN